MRPVGAFRLVVGLLLAAHFGHQALRDHGVTDIIADPSFVSRRLGADAGSVALAASALAMVLSAAVAVGVTPRRCAAVLWPLSLRHPPRLLRREQPRRRPRASSRSGSSSSPRNRTTSRAAVYSVCAASLLLYLSVGTWRALVPTWHEPLATSAAMCAIPTLYLLRQRWASYAALLVQIPLHLHLLRSIGMPLTNGFLASTAFLFWELSTPAHAASAAAPSSARTLASIDAGALIGVTHAFLLLVQGASSHVGLRSVEASTTGFLGNLGLTPFVRQTRLPARARRHRASRRANVNAVGASSLVCGRRRAE